MLPKAPHKELIKAEIKMRGESLISLSRKNKLARDSIASCLIRPIPRANKAVAKLLGVSLNHLWPQWFDANGERISSVSNTKHSAKRSICRSKKRLPHLTEKSGAA